MEYPFCELFGYDQAAIEARLRLLEIDNNNRSLAEVVHSEIILPNIDSLVNRFYDEYLLRYDDFRKVIGNPERVPRLKQSQTQYLLSFGRNCNTFEYFENRLRVGVAHDRVSLTLSLYECAYARLRELLYAYIDQIPDQEKRRTIRSFVTKIISLDMSLAIESYHIGKSTKLESSVRDLQDMQELLKRKASTDHLTGFATREAILSRLASELHHIGRHKRPLSVMMVDLDDLGSINDQYGHLMGDHVMREIAQRLQKMIGGNDSIGRYGGDEFLFLMTDMDKKQIYKFAEKIRQVINGTPVTSKKGKIALTASIGICVVTEKNTLPDVIVRVDKALFTAKNDGGNRISM